MEFKTILLVQLAVLPVDKHFRCGEDAPRERVEGMDGVVPDEVGRLDMAQVLGRRHEVVESSRFEESLLAIEMELRRGRVVVAI